MTNKKQILVILGNGFDIAFGLKSSYKDFFESNYWPFPRTSKKDGHRFRTPQWLDSYLNQRNMEENWYNLESMLAQYGESISEVNEDRLKWDRECFQKLKISLKQFITAAKKVSNPGSSNPAVRFLRTISEYRNPIIYTFNYTDVVKFADFVGIKGLSCVHVHGALEGTREIVFGVKDGTKIPDDYDFLRKDSEPTYRSSNMFSDLMASKEIVIFGHSLAENDYHYFSRFFQIHSDEYNSYSNNKCSITIITYNDQSRANILSNLRKMNNGNIDQLFALNDFRFLRTEEGNVNAMIEFDDWLNEFQD
ncbi:AbiH family protein [Pseudobutyrivibrio sp.]|jgi:hypothetical protein|uniref:AbiH family protein n=1 Tax=Pseudobutyrivibrio sp. TaxID=2014367 RepID=UPI00386FD7D7